MNEPKNPTIINLSLNANVPNPNSHELSKYVQVSTGEWIKLIINIDNLLIDCLSTDIKIDQLTINDIKYSNRKYIQVNFLDPEQAELFDSLHPNSKSTDYLERGDHQMIYDHNSGEIISVIRNNELINIQAESIYSLKFLDSNK